MKGTLVNLRILVIDDDEGCTSGLKDLLTGAGHRVEVADSGTAALAIAAGFAPDAALVDLGL
nr:hybrid sensor histidine kinase/response regulator [Deltaproteobacteria bacterium]